MKYVDDFLHGITMYRLLLYGLVAIAGVAIICGFFGILQLSGVQLLLSAGLLVATCFIANIGFAKLFGATTNTESALITALILFCLFLPPQTLSQGVILVFVGAMAMASKYVLAPGKRHILNPAAIAAVVSGVSGLMFAGWWIATGVMLPFVALLGLLILRKVHRFTMFFAFLAMSLLAITITSQGDGRSLQAIIADSFISWPLIFMGTIMLTEPATTPPTKRLQIAYGALVGLLLGSRLHIGDIYMTPELALVLGNICSYPTTLRKRITLTLLKKEEMAPSTFRFIFRPSAPLPHKAGQYVELTLPLKRADDRGNRRTFTVASSPTEQDIQFGIKLNTPPSSFKKALAELPNGGHVYTNQRAGDFVLPDNTQTKIAFIAGGIGITPYRSMLKQLIDTNQSRDMTLFYQVAAVQQIVYRDILEQAAAHGLKTVYVVTEKAPANFKGAPYETGFITKDTLIRHIPDFRERLFYISGPPAMVENYGKLLRGMGVRRWHIKTDYFAGY
jgi:glycine betaine catabolism B